MRALKILIVGAGAIGSLFSALLTEGGEDVSILDHRPDRMEIVNQKGLLIRGISGDRLVRVHVVVDPSDVFDPDLVIIAVKAYQTEEVALRLLEHLGNKSAILTIQNGLGNIERLGSFLGEERVLGGVTMHGSTFLSPGEIYHAAAGPTVVGELDGRDSERVLKIAEVFNSCNLETQVSTNIIGTIWSKLLINLGINAISAVTRMKNGELLKLPELRELMGGAVEEGITVCRSMHIRLETEDPVAETFKAAEATKDNKSSMLQDVEKGVRTEIDYINGAVVKIGRKYGIPVLVNETLTAVVKGLEYSTVQSGGNKS